MKKLFLILLACLLLCGCTGREAEVIPEYVLTYAENQPENHPSTMAAHYFADMVKERTAGRIVIQILSDSQLGTQQEILDQIAFGGIDFTRVSLSSLSDELPMLNVLQLPFLYEDADHLWRVLDGPIGDDFLQIFGEAGLVGMSWYDGGARSFYATTPIESAADLRGLHIRVQDSQMMQDMITLLGGVPVNIPYSDVYAAFQTGRIQAAENSWTSYEIHSHHLPAPYYTVDKHTRVPEVQLASGFLWEKLSEEDRAVILECAQASAQYERTIWTQQEDQARLNALTDGTREIRLEAAAYRELQELVQPLYEKYCGDYMNLIAQIQNG